MFFIAICPPLLSPLTLIHFFDMALYLSTTGGFLLAAIASTWLFLQSFIVNTKKLENRSMPYRSSMIYSAVCTSLFGLVMLVSPWLFDHLPCSLSQLCKILLPPYMFTQYLVMTFLDWQLLTPKRGDRYCLMALLHRFGRHKFKEASQGTEKSMVFVSRFFTYAILVFQGVVVLIVLGVHGLTDTSILASDARCSLGGDYFVASFTLAFFLILTLFVLRLQWEISGVVRLLIKEVAVMTLWMAVTFGSHLFLSFNIGLWRWFEGNVYHPDIIITVAYCGPLVVSVIPSCLLSLCFGWERVNAALSNPRSKPVVTHGGSDSSSTNPHTLVRMSEDLFSDNGGSSQDEEVGGIEMDLHEEIEAILPLNDTHPTPVKTKNPKSIMKNIGNGVAAAVADLSAVVVGGGGSPTQKHSVAFTDDLKIK